MMMVPMSRLPLHSPPPLLKSPASFERKTPDKHAAAMLMLSWTATSSGTVIDVNVEIHRCSFAAPASSVSAFKSGLMDGDRVGRWQKERDIDFNHSHRSIRSVTSHCQLPLHCPFISQSTPSRAASSTIWLTKLLIAPAAILPASSTSSWFANSSVSVSLTGPLPVLISCATSALMSR